MSAGNTLANPLPLPSITMNDLLDFHARHFTQTPDTQLAFPHSFPDLLLESRHDGFEPYSDGKQRTLTDEQIAIFRHSEIQQLLRARRVQQLQAADAVLDGGRDGVRDDNVSQSLSGMEQAAKRKTDATLEGQIANDGSSIAGVKRQKRHEELNGKTYRRIARELDGHPSVHVELDY